MRKQICKLRNPRSWNPPLTGEVGGVTERWLRCSGKNKPSTGRGKNLTSGIAGSGFLEKLRRRTRPMHTWVMGTQMHMLVHARETDAHKEENTHSYTHRGLSGLREYEDVYLTVLRHDFMSVFLFCWPGRSLYFPLDGRGRAGCCRLTHRGTTYTHTHTHTRSLCSAPFTHSWTSFTCLCQCECVQFHSAHTTMATAHKSTSRVKFKSLVGCDTDWKTKLMSLFCPRDHQTVTLIKLGRKTPSNGTQTQTVQL